MIGAEPGFPTCLAALLGISLAELPSPDGEPTVFWRQWLAGRNRGLVPVDDPVSFAWPGYWLAAAVDGSGRRDAVLMFGVPTGAVLDPAGLLQDGGTLVEGVVVAPFDLDLDASLPYGTPAIAGGVVEALLVAPAAEAPLVQVEEVEAVAGRGLSGDRYAEGAGTFSGSGRGYQLTLIEVEALAELSAHGCTIAWEDARRNVVTRGIGLNELVGHRFRVGEVTCVGRRLAEPCSHLERLAGPGVLRGLVHRGGLRADILAGGRMRIGDRVVVVGPDDLSSPRGEA